jgi:hypothetical protein
MYREGSGGFDMPVDRRGAKQSAYYYRPIAGVAKRKRSYVGSLDRADVRLVMRNDQLQMACEKAAADHQKLVSTNCKMLPAVWSQVMAILDTWRVLEISHAGRRFAEPSLTLHPYPWSGDRSRRDRYFQVRRLFYEEIQTPRNIEQLQRAGLANQIQAIRRLAGVIAHQRLIYTGVVDLLSICRDCMVEAVADGCPLVIAGQELQRILLNRRTGYEQAEPMERLFIEATTLTYMESFAYGALGFSDSHKPTHASLLSNTANQAMRRLTRLFNVLSDYRRFHGSRQRNSTVDQTVA